MLSINTNTSALMAQNNLNQTQNNLTASMERLSTGLRINSASDDAAGLQISNRMNTEIKGMDVAMRNANDAISMAQTAEGAMVETTNMLNRMRDLSLQAANGSNTAEDRQAMQDEVNQLVSQINDTASQTNFAGINLLDGSASSLSFQVGSNAGETISFGIGNMSASALKGTVKESNLGASLQANNNEKVTVTVVNASGDDLVVDVEDADGAGAGTTSDQDIVDAINADSEMKKNGVSAYLNDSNEIVLAGPNLDNYSKATVKSGGGTAADKNITDQDKYVGDIDLSTQAGAQQAAQILDGALAQVDKERANLGAVQNRLDYTVANLQNTQENLNTSMSRIKDVDFAKETTNMTKNQMMMQAGNTVLAQTKQMPQYAIQLLG
ncbi:flagellin N-terminal helical domain-containing protein [Spongorhabdus nitratireducens]